MVKKRIISAVISFTLLCLFLPTNFVFANTDKTQRTVYLHAQGRNPSATPDLSVVYMGENTEVYFAIDNPNKGLYENNIHKEPKYDMNGYTVKIYFDPKYFTYASDTASPFDYTVPNSNISSSESSENSSQEESSEVQSE